jgi:uncharacterized protein (DUF305 family)
VSWRSKSVKEDFTERRFCRLSAILLCLCAAAASGQQPAPIVQPGAPGHSNKILDPATAEAPPRPPSDADVAFMQGMIMHHGQAVEMTALLSTRSHDPEVQALGKRISISQTDEMAFMKRWLQDRGESIDMDMSHMDMSKPMMPGMLTAEQMKALEAATGPQFDHLFLTGMIQHHTGALTMVKVLFNEPGAGQDPRLFDFASDVDNTQLAEIDIMKSLLKKEKQ